MLSYQTHVPQTHVNYEWIEVLSEPRGISYGIISGDGTTRASLGSQGKITITRNGSTTYDISYAATSSFELMEMSGDGNILIARDGGNGSLVIFEYDSDTKQYAFSNRVRTTLPGSLGGIWCTVSADGHSIVFSHNSGGTGLSNGRVWIFSKPSTETWAGTVPHTDVPENNGATWYQSPNISMDRFYSGSPRDQCGTDVVLSADGTTLAISFLNWSSSTPNYGSWNRIYKKTNGMWPESTTGGTKINIDPKYLNEIPISNNPAFFPIDLSHDGKYFTVGGYHYNNGDGIVFVFELSGLGWVQKGEPIMTPHNESDLTGRIVQISNSGDTLFVPSDSFHNNNDRPGVVDVYTY